MFRFCLSSFKRGGPGPNESLVDNADRSSCWLELSGWTCKESAKADTGEGRISQNSPYDLLLEQCENDTFCMCNMADAPCMLQISRLRLYIRRTQTVRRPRSGIRPNSIFQQNQLNNINKTWGLRGTGIKRA